MLFKFKSFSWNAPSPKNEVWLSSAAAKCSGCAAGERGQEVHSCACLHLAENRKCASARLWDPSTRSSKSQEKIRMKKESWSLRDDYAPITCFIFGHFWLLVNLWAIKQLWFKVKVSNMLGLNHSGLFWADLVESCSNSGGDTVRRFHPDWHLNDDWMVQKSRIETNWTCFGSLNLNRT